MLCSCGQGEEDTGFLSFPLFWVQLKRKKFRLTTEPSLPTLSSPVSSQSPNWTQIRKGISLYRGAGGFCSAGFVLPKSREDQERSGRTFAVVTQVSTSHAKSATQVSQIMRDLMAKTRGHKATRFCTSPHCQENSALPSGFGKKSGHVVVIINDVARKRRAKAAKIQLFESMILFCREQTNRPAGNMCILRRPGRSPFSGCDASP